MPSAKMSSAVPATTWLTARLTTSAARIAFSATPAAAPAASPSKVEPEKNAAASAKNAPASIAPSMPLLITPLSSTHNSPSAASRIGAAIITTELRKPSSIARLRTLGYRRGTKHAVAQRGPRRSVEREQDQNHHSLDHLHQHRRDALAALHG